MCSSLTDFSGATLDSVIHVLMSVPIFFISPFLLTFYSNTDKNCRDLASTGLAAQVLAELFTCTLVGHENKFCMSCLVLNVTGTV